MGHRAHLSGTVTEIPSRFRPALKLLLEACRYAQQTDSDPWDFAVEMDQLTSLGLNHNDFRWLVRKGLVSHQREVTLDEDDGRAFRTTGDLVFPTRTCFVLTADGQLNANAQPALELRGAGGIHRYERNVSELGPRWDAETRELRLAGQIVKHFKWHAANQEMVLSAFEEEGWPHRIDDPLPPQPNQDSKRRLCDTIKCLNRKQARSLIHFHGDGTGQGVIWERVPANGERNGH